MTWVLNFSFKNRTEASAPICPFRSQRVVNGLSWPQQECAVPWSPQGREVLSLFLRVAHWHHAAPGYPKGAVGKWWIWCDSQCPSSTYIAMWTSWTSLNRSWVCDSESRCSLGQFCTAFFLVLWNGTLYFCWQNWHLQYLCHSNVTRCHLSMVYIHVFGANFTIWPNTFEFSRQSDMLSCLKCFQAFFEVSRVSTSSQKIRQRKIV